MTTTHFIFRQSTSPEQQGSIYMRVTHQRNTQSITLPTKIYSHEWDWEKERSNNKIANQEIEQAQDLVNKIIADLSLQGAYEAKDITLRYRCLTKAHSLESFTNELRKELISQNQARTARSYQTVVGRLCDFCKNPELPLSSITSTLMNDFGRYLFDQGLARNTISSYMRSL